MEYEQKRRERCFSKNLPALSGIFSLLLIPCLVGYRKETASPFYHRPGAEQRNYYYYYDDALLYYAQAGLALLFGTVY